MTFSIQTKFLLTCIVLVLLTALGISASYYMLTTQATYRESRQRIQIGFDIFLNDLNKRINTYRVRLDEFLKDNIPLLLATYAYTQDDSEKGTIRFLFDHFPTVSEALKNFGRIALFDRVLLYGYNNHLLAAYQHLDDEETLGAYLASEKEGEKYLEMDDPSIQSEVTFRANNLEIMITDQEFPDTPFPTGIQAQYEGEIPDTTAVSLFSESQKLGIRLVAPMYRREEKIGFVVGESFYTRQMIAEYAALSQTEISIFLDNAPGMGTLNIPPHIPSVRAQAIPSCKEFSEHATPLEIASVDFQAQEYYQGQCLLTTSEGDVLGNVTVNLSQQFEHQELRKILISVLTISGIAIAAAFILSVLSSRKTIHAIHHVVETLEMAAEGDLRRTTTVMTRDEMGTLALKLNQMIGQLRGMSAQVQQAAGVVRETADVILRQMDMLTAYIRQQSSSVENTADFGEQMQAFIETVAQKTNGLLGASGQILSAIQEARASIEEVTNTTGVLAQNVHLIFASIEQINQSVRQISANTEQLVEIADHTAIEVHTIEQSLHDVSVNADRTQQIAQETMESATRGHTSVDASIQGMTELKEMVTETALTIQDLSSWGMQVSSILGIVDEITEQTSLLALNASIISAQAGAHGRGFAVVANEIKELAVRTKASTSQIGHLIHELQSKTDQAVRNINAGITKAEQGMDLVKTVKDDLQSILKQATLSSRRAADTAQVISAKAESSQTILTSMTRMTQMVSGINTALQQQEKDMENVVTAVENMSGMSEQVNHASLEQKRAAEEIEHSMVYITDQFNEVSHQTTELTQNSNQMVTAIHTIEATTEQILQNVSRLSEDTVKQLLTQSERLQQLMDMFKIS